MSPYLIEQRVRREERTWLAGESAQDSERRRRESDRSSVAQQACVRLVQLELVEAHSYRVGVSGGSRALGTFGHLDPTDSEERPRDGNRQCCAGTSPVPAPASRQLTISTQSGHAALMMLERMRLRLSDSLAPGRAFAQYTNCSNGY